MAFWNLASSEPKRQHRYLVNFSGLEGYQEYLAKTCGTPGFTLSSISHKFLGNEYHYPGSVTWDEITIQLVNSINPDGNTLLMQALVGSGYLFPDDQAAAFNAGGVVGTPNKVDALAALGDVIIRELTGEGTPCGTWKLNNAFITSAKFGSLDYSGDEILNIDVTVKYDWATYESTPPAPVVVTTTS